MIADRAGNLWVARSAGLTRYCDGRWVWAACALIVTALAAGVVFWRCRELQRIHDLQRQHALDRERARIARDIHDDLGTGLTRLAMLGERAARESGDPAMQAIT